MFPKTKSKKPRLGLIGFGAFGQLMARHLAPHARILAHDPGPAAQAAMGALGVAPVSLAEAAGCEIVVLATPVASFARIAAEIAPLLRKGTLVCDVGSVKLGPAGVLSSLLPETVEIVATHPLFGPQSARDGLAGLKIALCPLRGARVGALARFLARELGLEVIVTTPERHDRDLAVVQGITHLVAKVLVELPPPATRMTTRSYDLLMQAVAMVSQDAPEVFDAIVRDNPHAAPLRARFFELAAKVAGPEPAPQALCAQSQ